MGALAAAKSATNVFRFGTLHPEAWQRRAPKAEDMDKAMEDYWKDDDAAPEAKESGLD